MDRPTLSARLRDRGHRVPRVDRAARGTRTIEAKEQDLSRVLSDTRTVLRSLHKDTPPAVARALAHIHRDLFEPTLTAGAVYEMEPGPRFRLAFRRATGYTVRQYLEHTRLVAAAHALALADVELYLIADAVGYDHYETFSRAFQRHFGVAPSTYRARMLTAAVRSRVR